MGEPRLMARTQSVLLLLSLIGCVNTASDFKTALVNESMANLFCKDHGLTYVDGYDKVSALACLAFCNPLFDNSEESMADGVFYMESSGYCRCYPDYDHSWTCYSAQGYKFFYFEGKYETYIIPNLINRLEKLLVKHTHRHVHVKGFQMLMNEPFHIHPSNNL